MWGMVIGVRAFAETPEHGSNSDKASGTYDLRYGSALESLLPGVLKSIG
jgi:hypothetical protein